MSGASDSNRAEVKALLAKANIEIFNALQRVDEMGDYELADARGRVGGAVAFFDFNGSCGASSLGRFDRVLTGAGAGNPVAFFDFNGSCGASGIMKSAGPANEMQELVLKVLGESS